MKKLIPVHFFSGPRHGIIFKIINDRLFVLIKANHSDSKIGPPRIHYNHRFIGWDLLCHGNIGGKHIQTILISIQPFLHILQKYPAFLHKVHAFMVHSVFLQKALNSCPDFLLRHFCTPLASISVFRLFIQYYIEDPTKCNMKPWSRMSFKMQYETLSAPDVYSGFLTAFPSIKTQTVFVRKSRGSPS